jgi:hypothetical protein
MSTEHKDADQNALATRLNRSWDSFKQGKIISYKLMAVLLILVATIGSTWYILFERRKANSQRWMALEEANSISSLEDISKNNPNTMQDRLARLQITRNQLGVSGIDQLVAINPEQRKKAIENIEKARESLGKLLEEFKDDKVFKTECLLGLAKAEAALVPVPSKEGQLTEFKGSIPKVVEWLDKLAEAAAPGTSWATDSKKLADALRDPNSQSTHEFFSIEQVLFKPLFGDLGAGPGTDPVLPRFPSQTDPFGGFPKGTEPFIPGVPIAPVNPAGLPKTPDSKTPSTPQGPVPPVGPSKGTEAPTPPGPIPPSGSPKGTEGPMPPGPIAPLPPGTPPKGNESATPKEPGSPIAPPPKIADPKAPNTPPAPTPQATDPKAPIAPGKPPEKK